MKEGKWIFHGAPDADMFDAATHMIMCAEWTGDLMACRFRGKFYVAKKNPSGSYTIRRNE